MSTQSDRRRMAVTILQFEARRENGHLAVYELPPEDGGGTYEVAGINDKYNKDVVDVLVKLINKERYDEAEAIAVDFIAEETDRAAGWTTVPALEFYLRDMIFNRGARGAAKILQDALNVPIDGAVGPVTLGKLRTAEGDPAGLLNDMRKARENYERTVAKRNESSSLWKGLVNRWNKALAAAHTFQMVPTGTVLAERPVAVEDTATAAPVLILPALRAGSTGARVEAWQAFLRGQDLATGVIDGEFGEHTRDATRAFQNAHGLAEDGIAGRQTLLKAAELGFELIEEPAVDNTSSNFPPPPVFPALSAAGRAALFGQFRYVSAPQPKNPEAIKILDGWEASHIVSVPIPQLRKRFGATAPGTMRFHTAAANQLIALWEAWDKANLLDRVLTYDGSFNPRFIRGSRTNLSNHAFGTAFDINASTNGLGVRPPLVGQTGCVRELVGIANDHGFFWGGHYKKRKDGMHFEVAVLK